MVENRDSTRTFRVTTPAWGPRGSLEGIRIKPPESSACSASLRLRSCAGRPAGARARPGCAVSHCSRGGAERCHAAPRSRAHLGLALRKQRLSEEPPHACRRVDAGAHGGRGSEAQLSKGVLRRLPLLLPSFDSCKIRVEESRTGPPKPSTAWRPPCPGHS